MSRKEDLAWPNFKKVNGKDFPGAPVAKIHETAVQGTRSHMLQLKILHPTTNTEDPACLS